MPDSDFKPAQVSKQKPAYPTAKPVAKPAPKPIGKPDPKNDLPDNYKTIMCRSYEKFGKCTYAKIGCTYAHGQKELNFGRNKLSQINSAPSSISTTRSTLSVVHKPAPVAKAAPFAAPKIPSFITVAGSVNSPVVSQSSKHTAHQTTYDNYDYDDYDDHYDEEYDKQAWDPKKNPLYTILHKTSMCNNIVKTGVCSYGHTCSYAHSIKELK
jgi:hypothetical protein